jgi:putative hydrolase of the HAD superfamily
MFIAKNKKMDWLIDLDNCLYPYDNGLYHFINERMNRYIMNKLQMDPSKVDQLRTHFIHKYGNTLLGLMLHHQVDAEDFLQDVHDFPLDSFIKKDPLLIDFIDTHIKGKFYVFTNSPSFYAYRVLELLQIDQKVSDVFDIHFVSFKGKPHKSAFQKVMESSGLHASSSYFIDDMKENIATAQELGFHTIHIDTSIPYKNNYYSDLFIPRVLACKRKREGA